MSEKILDAWETANFITVALEEAQNVKKWKRSRDGVPKNLQTRMVMMATKVKGQSLLLWHVHKTNGL